MDPPPYRIDLTSERLDAAFREASRVEAELHDVAEAVAVGIDDSVARARKRLRGWGSEDLDLLVDRMATGTSNEKGLRLEELTTRLFATVPGFSANGRVLTETEEIDVTITNGAMEHPAWSRASALLLAECKNWSTVCGKNEFVLFEDKLRNRAGRVSMGFLISWNGFADTIEKSMLRGSRGDLLMVPLTGQDLRDAVRNASFPELLEERHQQATSPKADLGTRAGPEHALAAMCRRSPSQAIPSVPDRGTRCAIGSATRGPPARRPVHESFATDSAVSPRAGERLNGPDDAQVERREVAALLLL